MDLTLGTDRSSCHPRFVVLEGEKQISQVSHDEWRVEDRSDFGGFGGKMQVSEVQVCTCTGEDVTVGYQTGLDSKLGSYATWSERVTKNDANGSNCGRHIGGRHIGGRHTLSASAFV